MSEAIPQRLIDEARDRANAIIVRMCVTMDHSFGLQTPEEQKGLRLQMKQLAEHDIFPAIAAALFAAEKRGSAEALGLLEVFADAGEKLDAYLLESRGVRLGEHHVVNAAISPLGVFPLCLIGDLRQAAALRNQPE